MELQQLLDRAEQLSAGVAGAFEPQVDREITAYTIYPHAVRAVYREQAATGRHLDNITSEYPITVIDGEGVLPDAVFREFLDRSYLPQEQFGSLVPFEDYGRYRYDKQMTYFAIRGNKLVYSGDVPRLIGSGVFTATSLSMTVTGDASMARVGDRFTLIDTVNSLVVDAFISSINGTTDFTVVGRTLAATSGSMSGTIHNGQDDAVERSVVDLVTDASTSTVTSAAALFTSADVGKRLTSHEIWKLNRSGSDTFTATGGSASLSGINVSYLDIGSRIVITDANGDLVIDSIISAVSYPSGLTTELNALISASSGTVTVYRPDSVPNWTLVESFPSATVTIVQDETENAITGASFSTSYSGKRIVAWGEAGVSGDNPVLDALIIDGTGTTVETTTPAVGSATTASVWVYQNISSAEEVTTTVVDAVIRAVTNASTAVLGAKPLWTLESTTADIKYSPLLLQTPGIPSLPSDLCDDIALSPEVAEDVIVKIAEVLRGEVKLESLIELGQGG